MVESIPVITGRNPGWNLRKIAIVSKTGEILSEIYGMSTLKKGDYFFIQEEPDLYGNDPTRVWLALTDPIPNKSGVLGVEAVPYIHVITQ